MQLIVSVFVGAEGTFCHQIFSDFINEDLIKNSILTCSRCFN